MYSYARSQAGAALDEAKKAAATDPVRACRKALRAAELYCKLKNTNDSEAGRRAFDTYHMQALHIIDATRADGYLTQERQLAAPAAPDCRPREPPVLVANEGTPSLSFSEIGGCGSAKKELARYAASLKRPEVFKKWGLQPPRGILLYGPPGTGKTLLGRAAASEVGANFLLGRNSAIVDSYLGRSEKNLKGIFDYARAHQPAIIFFDEVDALVPRRTSDVHEAILRIESEMLQEMDGFNPLSGVLVMGATNRKDAIDPAFLRPGRFDVLIEVGPPNEEERAEIFKIQMRDNPLEKIDFERIAAASHGLSGAEIRGVIDRALAKKVDEELKGGKPMTLSTEDLLAQLLH